MQGRLAVRRGICMSFREDDAAMARRASFGFSAFLSAARDRAKVVSEDCVLCLWGFLFSRGSGVLEIDKF